METYRSFNRRHAIVSTCNKTHFGHNLISVEAIKEPCVLD